MDLKRKLIKKLHSIMPEHEAQSEIDFLLREYFNYPRIAQITNPARINDFAEELSEIIDIRVSTGKPLQYIINKAAFFDDIYYVDENVLIPRPETEILVNEVYKKARNMPEDIKILDIGTGSGCIAISLAKLLNSNNISAIDISDEALIIARLNAKSLCPNLNINFFKSDLFENVHDKFNIIVSNPPYINPSMKPDMQPEVKEHEPPNALFAQNDGMYFYEKITEHAPDFLNSGGILAFEAGINQALKIKKILENKGFSKIIIIPDFISIDRVVLGMLF